LRLENKNFKDEMIEAYYKAIVNEAADKAQYRMKELEKNIC
jgi:hypothetical protein